MKVVIDHQTPTGMEPCTRCKKAIWIEDHKCIAHGDQHVGTPGKHVRRFMCDCGCKDFAFYWVLSTRLMASSAPLPGYERYLQPDMAIFPEFAKNLVNDPSQIGNGCFHA